MISYVEKIEAKTFKPTKPNKPTKATKPNKSVKPKDPKKPEDPIKPKKSLAQDVNEAEKQQKQQEALDKIKQKTSPNFIRLKQYLPLLYNNLDTLDLTKPKVTKQWILFFKEHGPTVFVRLLRDLDIIKNADMIPMIKYLTNKIHGV